MIDPGEALLAEVGIRPVIERSVRITAPQKAAARRMQPRIEMLAAKLVLGTLDGDEAGGEAIDYDDMLSKFSEPPSEDEQAAMLKSIAPEDHDEASAFLFTAGRAFQYLQQSFPVSVKRKLVGAQNLPPSMIALTTFEFALAIVDKPLGVFALLDSGALLSTQVKALRGCYPTIAQAIAAAIFDRMSREPAGYEAPFSLALSTLTDSPYIDPKLTAALGVASQYRAQEAQKVKDARQQQPQKDRVAEMTTLPSDGLRGE